jgi:hypothetical protein
MKSMRGRNRSTSIRFVGLVTACAVWLSSAGCDEASLPRFARPPPDDAGQADAQSDADLDADAGSERPER